MSKKIIYYYQTFCGLGDILNKSTNVTHIHLSSIHFGIDNNKKYIHLNDYDPYNSRFDNLWKEIKIAKDLNIKIILMVGGAGSAYNTLFSDFELYYNMIKNLIIDKNINGIDLDIEEIVELDKIIMLINRLYVDFGKDFIISMAPIQGSMESDVPGMGGFIYKDLYNKVGNKISYFNVQCYFDYSLEAYERIINNNYPENKIIMGSISNQDFTNTKKTLNIISKKYSNFAGAYNWEYFDSPPNSFIPGLWSVYVSDAINFCKYN